jgi:flagellar hook-associated protein 3 FlgL
MRISTAGMHYAALARMAERNNDLVKTQNQLASGKRIQTPADDPSGAVRALGLDREIAENAQFSRNADMATSRLSLEEQTLDDATSLLQHVRDLAIQANNPTLDLAGRKLIATEVNVRLRELVDLANRRDANGEYLFSGFSTLTQPFTQSGNAVTYAGDQGVRELQISQTQRLADGHTGFEVFETIVEGNATFVTAVAATNAGSAVIDAGTVTDPTAWVPDTYTIRFLDATSYEIVDGAGDPVTTGTYTSPGTIAFNGIQVGLQGAPAANDEFTVRASASQSMFTTVANLITTLGRDTITNPQNARFASEMGGAIAQIDRALDHVGGVRSEVGARLASLDAAAVTRDDRDVELQRSLSELRDLDYAEAVTRLNLQLAGLQAAQASYSRITQLSLFNYL